LSALECRREKTREGKDLRDLLTVLVEADTGRGSTVATTLNGTNANDVGVDSARDAVVDLEVELGENVLYNNISKVKS